MGDVDVIVDLAALGLPQLPAVARLQLPYGPDPARRADAQEGLGRGVAGGGDQDGPHAGQFLSKVPVAPLAERFIARFEVAGFQDRILHAGGWGPGTEEFIVISAGVTEGGHGGLQRPFRAF